MRLTSRRFVDMWRFCGRSWSDGSDAGPTVAPCESTSVTLAHIGPPLGQCVYCRLAGEPRLPHCCLRLITYLVEQDYSPDIPGLPYLAPHVASPSYTRLSPQYDREFLIWSPLARLRGGGTSAMTSSLPGGSIGVFEG